MQINVHRNALILFVLAISMLFIGKAKFAEANLFGWDVSESGGNVLVGSPNYHVEGTRAGAAFLFDSNTGRHLQTFVNPTPDYADQFGLSVAGVNGNVLVGAWYDDTGANDAGAAYLFDPTSGDVLDTYFSPSPAFAGYFSTSVATVGEKVFIGEIANSPGSGKVYLIESSTGRILKTFVDPNPTSMYFGCSVAAIGNNVLVGASGEAFLFDITNGDLLHTFADPNPSPNEYGFGSAVSISEDKAIIRNHITGMTYVYDISSGALIRSHSTVGQAGGHKSITFLNDNYILGNEGKSEAYLFEGNTGTLLHTFYKPNQSVSGFGWSVATVGDDIIIGCRDFGFGEAYLFDGISGDLIHTFNTDFFIEPVVVSPTTINFGDIGTGNSANQVVTISNTAGHNYITNITLEGSTDYQIVSNPSLPFGMFPPPNVPNTADVVIEYSPSSIGTSSTKLLVSVFVDIDGTSHTFEVPINGNGILGETPPSGAIADILAFFDASVDDGTLEGVGPANSAYNRLMALRNMIKAAGGLPITEACQQLQDAYISCDGEAKPREFADGNSRDALATMILDLMASMGCP